MPSANKNKGNRGERALALLLGAIFNGNFIRVPNSGAMVGGINAARKAFLSQNQQKLFKGDLIPPDFMPKFVVECKFYKEFRFHQLLSPDPCPQLDEWIGQTLDCIDPGDAWYVCFKIVRLGWFVAVPDSNEYKFDNHCVYKGNYGSFRITDLSNFFAINRDLILKKSI